MQECIINWWQSPLFIAIIPIIGGFLGWCLNILYTNSSPYKIDRDIFEKIQDIYNANINAFYLAIYVGMYQNEERKKFFQFIRQVEDERYSFQDKKLQKDWNEIRQLIVKIGQFIIQKATKDGNNYLIDFKENKLQENFANCENLQDKYNALLKKARKKLYVERIKK